MSELHKPLGQAAKKPSKLAKWVVPALAVGAVGLAATAAYLIFDARQEPKAVVALKDAKEQAPAPKPAAPEATEKKVDESEPTFKPLSPLEPIDEPGSAQNGATPTPSFKPVRPTTNRRAVGVPDPNLIEKSEFGPLPQISDSGTRPLDIYSQASSVVSANRVAIVIGGLGLSQTGTLSTINDLPSSVTLGFSPLGNSLQRWMQKARREGHEVVLQLPMEPLGYPTIDPGPRTLVSTAGTGKNLANLRWSLGRMTNYPIVMNYLGAGLLNKPEAIKPILEELARRGVAVLDDGSVQTSALTDLARQNRVPHVKGDVIIDANRNAAAIQRNLAALEGLAKSRGYAIGTATAFPGSVEAVRKWVDAASKRGIAVVPLSSLVRDYKR